MPVRKSPDKKVFGGPQGSDAFVTVKRLTVEEVNAFTQKFTALQEKAVDAESREEGELEARKSIAALLLDWNWVDNDGQPFPKPHNNSDLIGQLYNEELTWITQAIMDTTPEQLAAAKKKGR